MPAQTVIKLRRDTAANWDSINPVLAAGEMGIETDTGLHKFGDGTTAWGALPYASTSKVVQQVKNTTGSNIPKGSVVYISGATGGDALISLADADSEVTSSKTLGLTVTEIANDDYGMVIEQGLITGVNTASANAGDSVWLSTIAGQFVFGMPPVKPAHSVYLGVVIRAHANQGEILIKVQNGYELNELHDVNIDLLNVGEVLQWDGNFWTNQTIDLSSKQDVVPGVSSTEIGYLDGVTSGIQTQLNNKQDAVAGVSSVEIGYLDGVTSSIQEQLNGKQAIVAGVSDTEIGYLDGVTSGIQEQLNGKLSLSGGTMTGKITLDSDPIQALHAVTKQYVDSIEAGLVTKPQVRAATTGNLSANYSNGTNGVGATLTSTTNGAFPLIDGVTITTVNGQRGVLVKNQTNAAHNGRYNLTTQGDANTPWVLTRCGLCDEADEIPGAYVFVTDGTVNGQTGWVQHVDNPATFVVGTDAITVFQFAGPGTVTAGNGIVVEGNQVSVDFDDVAAKSHTHVVADITDLTATASELNVLDGITASTAELNHTDGVTSNIQTQLDARALLTQPIIPQTGTYTLLAGDRGDMITCTGTFTINVPGNVFAAGDRVDFINVGSGIITFAGSSLTLNAADAKFTLNKQWAGATVFFTSATTAVLIGNIA